MHPIPIIPNSDTRGSNRLQPNEILWLSRYGTLKAHGYLLRPRYRPGWSRHWPEGTSTLLEEEAVIAGSKNLDAERISDGLPVFLKPVQKTSLEAPILQFLSTEELRDDDGNHAVPLLDVLDDPALPDGVILVMPLLRPITSPFPTTVYDCYRLVEQTLKGLSFLHRHQIAHRDCAISNIMMEGRALLPKGWHPEEFLRSRDLQTSLRIPSLREVNNHRYYFIDFGISTAQQNLTLGLDGRERAPELSSTVPYDPYKLDVYVLGKTYEYLFKKLFSDTVFLHELIVAMTLPQPSERPSAEECYQRIRKLKIELSAWELSRRVHLHSSKESFIERAWRDFNARILELWWRCKGQRSVPIPS